MLDDVRPVSAETEALAALLHLGKRARQARDRAELAFVLVNETHGLAPYRQAALWLDGRVHTLSGVVSVEANIPYVQWLEAIFRHLDRTQSRESPRSIEAGDLPIDGAAQWGEWLPPEALWLPLQGSGKGAPGGAPGGALLLARSHPWTQAEADLAAEWAATWAHAWALHQRGGLWRRHSGSGDKARSSSGRGRFLRWVGSLKLWAAAAAICTLFIPVKLTVLAPAELVPLAPSIVRSPLDGVIDSIAVIPGQRVKANDPLFTFDRTSVASKLLIAEKALETVRTEYRQRAQQALFDEQSKSHLAVLQGQVAEKSVEVDYLRSLESRSIVTAPRDGIALFDDPTEWIGRPLVTGERVMMVADEKQVEVEAWLAPANAVPLPSGAPVTLYLNADPLQPLSASLRYIAHEAVRRPDGHYAYRVRATLTGEPQTARTGLKGTAKLEGEQVPLVYWALRRPFADARAWLGL
ncbi:HlyD family efflux transporter periplasmic adaptor subunit [Azospirillum melinis]|uniref:HlyD family efflux transporter periplasmic adaptor subunit n=2 Tax=Azospirillum melinis TaxID=328839 RepID=A0ABX2KEN6_9PROT|nr:HlyD family efflux transporter periplasmic adaptor subunit [Azospirillum melinis]